MKRAIHPGVFISEELTARGWSRDDLATRIAGADTKEWGVARLALDFYLDAGPGTPAMLMGDFVHDLARVFGTSVELWTNLEASWRAAHGNPKGGRE